MYNKLQFVNVYNKQTQFNANITQIRMKPQYTLWFKYWLYAYSMYVYV